MECPKCHGVHFQEAEFKQYHQGTSSANVGGELFAVIEHGPRVRVCLCGHPMPMRYPGGGAETSRQLCRLAREGFGVSNQVGSGLAAGSNASDLRQQRGCLGAESQAGAFTRDRVPTGLPRFSLAGPLKNKAEEPDTSRTKKRPRSPNLPTYAAETLRLRMPPPCTEIPALCNFSSPKTNQYRHLQFTDNPTTGCLNRASAPYRRRPARHPCGRSPARPNGYVSATPVAVS